MASNISGFTNFHDEKESFFDQSQAPATGNLNTSEIDFTMEEHDSQGIGPRDLGMRDSEISDIDDEDHQDTSINGARRVIRQSWSDTNQGKRPTTTLDKLTLAEGTTEISYLEKVLDLLSSPFAHETGFYFKGRKQYTI